MKNLIIGLVLTILALMALSIVARLVWGIFPMILVVGVGAWIYFKYKKR